MNTVRVLMSVFLLAVVILSFLGWRWAVELPPPKLEAARLVLAISGIAALGAMALIWSTKPRQSC